MTDIDFMAAVETDPGEHFGSNLPTRKDPFDPACIEDLFDVFYDAIADIHVIAENHQVTGDDSHTKAVDMVGQTKQLISQIEKKRKEVKAPYLSMVQAIDGFCKPLTNQLGDIATGLTAKIRPYLMEIDRKRREAQAEAEAAARASQAMAQEEARAKAEAERARLQAEADAMAAANKTEKVIVPEVIPDAVPVFIPVPTPTATRTQSEAGTASLKTEWKATIVDFRQLPDECFESRKDQIEKALMPWVNAQVKAGIRNIPGCVVQEVARVDVRAKR